MKVSCPAKINIGLKVNSKRPDGYHDLETEFRLISLYDYLEIKESKIFQLNINNDEIETEDNLITKAYFLMKSLCNEKSEFSFKVKKNIPIGAGLGGGSSNCASTLIVLNRLFKLNLTVNQLLEIGLSLGSDVPFFIKGKNSIAKGRGELLKTITSEANYYLIIYPDINISTANAFRFYDENKTDFPTDLKNDFEYFARKVYPEINEIFRLMSQYGTVELSGTGSSMYLNFKSSEEAYTIATKVPTNCKFFVTRSLDKSPIYDELNK